MPRGTGARPATGILAAIIVTLAILTAGFSAHAEDGYYPSAAASRIVTAVPDGSPRTGVVILTEAQPQGQLDPQEQKTFGVLYEFSPRMIFVHRDEPTSFSFWNLQSDETHDFMLSTALGQVLMKMMLPRLKKTSVTLTFHKEGLYTFYCTMHQPEMSGQIYVLPPPR
jgi:cupredoxin-like protein